MDHTINPSMSAAPSAGGDGAGGRARSNEGDPGSALQSVINPKPSDVNHTLTLLASTLLLDSAGRGGAGRGGDGRDPGGALHPLVTIVNRQFWITT